MTKTKDEAEREYEAFSKARADLKQELLDGMRNGNPMSDTEFIERDRLIRSTYMKKPQKD